MKLVYLIGMPGTGKTTVMREFMSHYGPWKHSRPVDLLDTMVDVNSNLRVLGKYEDGETFAGTDRLSMAVAPKAIEFIASKPDEFIVGEGDRLNNRAFFESAGDDLHIIHLTTSKEERERRYNERGSNQSESFIKTAATKCENIVNQFGDRQTLFGEEKGCIDTFVHETPEDTTEVVLHIRHLFLADSLYKLED